MESHDVVRTLDRIATLLELQNREPHRARAFRAAARSVTARTGEMGTRARTRGGRPGRLAPEPRAVVDDLLETGRSRVLDDLLDRTPSGLLEILEIPGIGLAKTRQIFETLDIETLDELDEAARDGRLATLPHFGHKTAANVARAIALQREARGTRLFHHALAEAQALAHVLADLPEVRSATVVGSVRRRREVIQELDLVVETDGAPDDLSRQLAETPTVSVREGGRGTSLRFRSGAVARIHPAPSHHLGFHLVAATGSAPHLDQLSGVARAAGFEWTPAGLRRGGGTVDTPTEESLYAALGLIWIPPELREGTGEVEAARAGRLPTLVDRAQLRGFVHCHTTYSDGTTTIAQWSAACGTAGFEYVGVTDHSQTSAYAGGLGTDDVARQWREIDEVNRRGGGAIVLKGVEADILEDGTLDYTPDVRRGFDFIIASIHTRHGMGPREMTRRVLRAMDDPTMTILGHPTGRLLLSRDPFELDLDRVFRTAAERGIAIEINADPQRLDLDWRLVRQATDAGVTISIGADAHGTAGLSNMDIGIGIARKGWLTADRVLNTLPLEGFREFARRRRS